MNVRRPRAQVPQAIAMAHSITAETASPFAFIAESFKPEPWVADALCAQTDPELWFPEKGGSTKQAKAICGSCDVKEQCLQYALDNEERFGIWGQHSERERRKMLRDRRAA